MHNGRITTPILFKGAYAGLWVALSLVSVLAVIIPTAAKAEEGYVGISLGWVNLDNSGGDFNPLQSEVKLGLSLAAKSEDRYFSSSQVGYFFEYGLDTFEAEESVEWGLGPTQTINTSVTGIYLHYTPVIFYDLTKNASVDWSFKVGIGLGVSHFTVDGTMIFNNPSPAVRGVDDDAFGLSKSFIIRFENEHLLVQVKENTPTGEIHGVDMELQLPLITVAYKYRF